MTTTTDRETMIRVCSRDELERDRMKVASVDGRTVLVLIDQENVYALDNRCPHLGFPLHRGSVRDGILTCHWHHARFDLCGGCAFDLWADDVPAYDVEIRAGVVYVSSLPRRADPREHYRRRLQEGLAQGI